MTRKIDPVSNLKTRVPKIKFINLALLDHNSLLGLTKKV